MFSEQHVFFMRDETTPLFSLSFHPSAFNIFKVREGDSRGARQWSLSGGDCLVARRGFGCGALGLAVTVCRFSLTGGLAAPDACGIKPGACCVGAAAFWTLCSLDIRH